MSNDTPEPAASSAAELRTRDLGLTSSLVSVFVDTRAAKGALEAFEITTLAAASALVQEQTDRVDRTSSRLADIPSRTMVAELATAARVSERTIQRQMADAADLCDRFPQAVVALREGRISRGHVSVIHEAGHGIDDADARARYEQSALTRAEELTPGRLRPIAQVLAARADPRSIDERHAAARALRSVRVVDLADAMAELTFVGPAVLAHGIHDRLTQQAHAVIDARPAAASADDADAPAPDTRSVDELRADIFADLLLTGTPDSCIAGDGLAAIRAIVQVTVPVLTAAGTGGEPALLAGHGPIDTETARVLAGGAKGWERVMTCPTTGGVLAVDRYRPGEDLKRFLRARDEHCRFPGCRMPAWRCDIDHTIDAAHGGPTCACNLEDLCRGHHTLKHASEWQVVQLAGGVLHWRSPTGRTYIDRPEPTLRFVPDDPATATLLRTWRTAPPDDPVWGFTPDGDPPPF
ncbi:MAG TPA: DUF222 domain-containing protein [Microbacterium sp.]|nr:DUF222 domain-containing protein [Microbacterium sp.]